MSYPGGPPDSRRVETEKTPAEKQENVFLPGFLRPIRGKNDQKLSAVITFPARISS